MLLQMILKSAHFSDKNKYWQYAALDFHQQFV